MQVCGVSLAPDVTYFLDAAVEHGELDGLTHATLNLLGDRKTVMDIVDNDHPPKVRDGSCAPYLRIRGRGLAVRQGICYSLNSYARAIVAGLDRPYQRAFVAQSLIEEKLRSRELAEILASWNYEDSTVGGALESYRKGKDVRLRADGSPTPKVHRRLCSPSAIRRYVMADPAQSLRHHANLAAGISTLPWPDHPAEAKLLESLFETQEEARKIRRDLAMREFISKLDRDKPSRRVRRESRKRLVRSAMMSDRLLGREPTRAFLRGEAVTVPATSDMVFQIKSERIGGLGAGAVKVSLAASKGDRLANLCLYFDQTPPLDQLVAIALHAEAGNADELVRTGNLYGVTEAGASHPALKERAEVLLPAAAGDLQFITRRSYGYDRARQDRLVKDYHRDYGAHYRRALEDFVWRSQAPRLRRFWALMEVPGLHVEERK